MFILVYVISLVISLFAITYDAYKTRNFYKDVPKSKNKLFKIFLIAVITLTPVVNTLFLILLIISDLVPWLFRYGR
jgi:uncharacterized membrane protein YwzB